MGWILVIVAMSAFGLWYLSASNKNRTTNRVVRHRSIANRYHAVLIKTRGRGCAQIQAFKDKPFLASEAPSVPLADCTSSNCGCRYMHLADRRQEQRRSTFSSGALHYEVAGNDRRKGGDRRRALGAA